MKKYLFSILIVSLIFGFFSVLNTKVALAECPTQRVASVLNLSFSPSSIAANQISKVVISGKVGTWASDCSSISNAKIYLIYKYTGGEFKSGPLSASVSKTLIPLGATITISDTVSWDKISKGKAMATDSVPVSVAGVVEGSVNFTKNFPNKLTIGKQAAAAQNSNANSGSNSSTAPKLTGDPCKDLSAQFNAFGGGRAASLPTYCDTNSVYTKIVGFAYYIIGIAAVISLIYGGYMFMTASSNDSQRTKAKNIILWTLAGVALAILANVIVAIIINLVVDNKFF